jgi:hypothetical protein
MANVFDTANYPQTEPTLLQAGDRWAWRRPDLTTDYPTATYSLSYVARREGTGERIAITASETTDGYVVEVDSSVTATYEPGRYQWSAFITRTSDSARAEIGYGSFEVKANRATSTDDPRSTAQVMLDNIEAYLKDPSNLSAASYSIAGRSLSRWNRADLLEERDRLKAEINREVQAEKLRKGLGTNQQIRVRFTR